RSPSTHGRSKRWANIPPSEHANATVREPERPPLSARRSAIPRETQRLARSVRDRGRGLRRLLRRIHGLLRRLGPRAPAVVRAARALGRDGGAWIGARPGGAVVVGAGVSGGLHPRAQPLEGVGAVLPGEARVD